GIVFLILFYIVGFDIIKTVYFITVVEGRDFLNFRGNTNSDCVAAKVEFTCKRNTDVYYCNRNQLYGGVKIRFCFKVTAYKDPVTIGIVFQISYFVLCRSNFISFSLYLSWSRCVF